MSILTFYIARYQDSGSILNCAEYTSISQKVRL